MSVLNTIDSMGLNRNMTPSGRLVSTERPQGNYTATTSNPGISTVFPPATTPPPEIFQPNKFPFTVARAGVNPSLGMPFLERAGDMISRAGDVTLQPLETDQSQLIKYAMPKIMQQVLNSLGSRNMLNSSVAGSAMGQAMSGLGGQAMQLANQNAMYNSQIPLQESGLMSQLAGTLSNMGGIGGQMGAWSESISTNPLAPYELLNNFVLGF